MDMTRARKVALQKLRTNLLQVLTDQFHLGNVACLLCYDLLKTTLSGF